MRLGRQDAVAALIFAAVALVGLGLWQSESGRIIIADVAKWCGF
jgi:hypothetical protein